MHELAICQSLLKSALQTARLHKAVAIAELFVSIGPLSGVEAPLLQRAWTIARAGTLASEARLCITHMPIMVKCSSCGHQGPAKANALICENCHDWRVTLVSGDEMLLTSLELIDTRTFEGAC